MSSAKLDVQSVPGVQLQITSDLSTTQQRIQDPQGNLSSLAIATNTASCTGNFGIGILPTNPLHVGNGKNVRFEMGSGTMFSLGAPGQVNIDAVDVPGGRFTVLNNGLVGIGQPNPQASLDVNGTIKAVGLSFSGPLAVPGMQPESAAPSGDTLEAVYIDTKTGILYYHTH